MKRFALVLIATFMTLPLWGLNLEPLSAHFTPSGRNSIRTFRVSNTQEENIAVRVRMTTRELLADGREVRNPADDEFTVFPANLFLAPGQSQAVRVQWRGEQELTREQAYRIVVEQLPVQDDSKPAVGDGGGLSLNFIYRYIGAVYVTPPGARADIILKSSEVQIMPHAATVLALEFVNQGAAHSIVRNAGVTIRGRTVDGRAVEYSLESQELPVLSGANFIAGSTLVQRVSMPDQIQASTIEVQHRIESAR